MKFSALPRRIRRQQLLSNAVAVESLERRRLLAASVVNDVLTVDGTGNSDTITINPSGANAVVSLNGTSSSFALNSFTSILVNANGGSDNVTVANAITKPAKLLGGSGNDSLVGGGGSDTLDGQAGADTMKGGSGNDTVDYASRTGGVVVGPGTAADDGEAGEKDNVWFDVETVLGGSGNDVMSARPQDVINNLFVGNGGNDSLSGGAGNDTLSGNAGTDTLNGGDGNDTATNSTGDTLVSIENGGNSGGGQGTAVITADRTLLITGTSNADDVQLFFGLLNSENASVVLINGVEKRFKMDDFDRIQIDVLGGNDNVNIDVPSLGSSGRIIGTAVDLGAGNDRIELTEAGATITGGDGNDSVFGTDGGGPFDGGAGVDYYERSDPDGSSLDLSSMPTVENGKVNFGTLIGNGLANVLEAGDNSTVKGGGGDDTIIGGADIDGVLLEGGEGNDLLTIPPGNDGSATLRGQGGNDTLQGGNGNDILDGGAGADLIRGGAGNDTVDYSARTGNVTVGLGTVADDGEANEKDNVATDVETILGGSGSDALSAANAGNKANLLVGNGGNDSLTGGDGNDTLSGNAGTDTLNGGNGTDTATNATGDTLISIENSGGGGGGGQGTAYLVGRDLFVDGTAVSGDDVVLHGDSSVLDIRINGAMSQFPRADFDRVFVRGFGGDDDIDVDTSGEFHIDLDAGDDVVSVRGARVTVVGGDGDDSVTADDESTLAVFDGGAGRDTIVSLVHTLLDLNDHPGVEDAALHNQGTIVGNALNNTLRLLGSDAAGGTLIGNGGNDVLLASDSNGQPVSLSGGPGDDSLQGGSGNDTLDGGSGADTMKGGAGNDTVDYSSRSGNVTVGLGTVADDGEANEKDNVATDIETILGGSGNDALSAANAGTVANLLVGNGGNDSLTGGEGNDTLSGNGGTDTLNGGDGTDTATNANGDTLISIEVNGGGGGTGPDAFIENGDLIVRGTDGADSIVLSADSFGDPSNPTESVYRVVFVGTGVEKTFTWQQFDRVRVFAMGESDHIELYKVTSFTPTILELGNGNDHADLYDNSTAEVIGGAGNDFVRLENSTIAAFIGGDGVDSISDDGTVNLDLRNYPDVENADAFSGTIIGNALDNDLSLIYGGTLQGMGGNDTLLAGDGEADVDVLDGGEGNDSIEGYFGPDSITGGGGNDTLLGDDGADTIDGGAGDDFIDGGLANDIMKGGDGNDTVTYIQRNTGVRVGIGTLADDGNEDDFFADNVYLDIETVIGGSGNDTLTGGAANNRLVGNGGNDSIKGNYGDDTLVGGPGTDTLNGENGTDTAQDASGDILISVENS